jgi:hypothetical protein
MCHDGPVQVSPAPVVSLECAVRRVPKVVQAGTVCPAGTATTVTRDPQDLRDLWVSDIAGGGRGNGRVKGRGLGEGREQPKGTGDGGNGDEGPPGPKGPMGELALEGGGSQCCTSA